jgi:SAM-dependent methyltransferase
MSRLLDLLKKPIHHSLKLTGYEIHRSAEFRPQPVGLEGLIPPRHLWGSPPDPLYMFIGGAWEYRAYLTLLCGLRKDASVLELGCNTGRTMLLLLNYLEPPGRYEGLDILPAQINFAQRNIHSRYPHFNFNLADVYNKEYFPMGKQSADTYTFPFADSWFDVVYACSLFTHLIPPDTANYFKESKRVMRKGGRCMFSFFVLDYYKGPGTSTRDYYEFNYPLPGFDGVAIHDEQIPEKLIAYKMSLIEQMAAEAGLRVKQIVPGFWSKSHMVGVNEQDLIVFEAV